MDFGSTLTQKYAGVPVWIWAVLGTGGLSLYLIHRKNTSGSTSAAASQTSTNLGSASQLANLFQDAFPMSYQGGDFYINNTNTVPAGAPAPQPPTHPIQGGNPPVGGPGSPYTPGLPYIPLPFNPMDPFNPAGYGGTNQVGPGAPSGTDLTGKVGPLTALGMVVDKSTGLFSSGPASRIPKKITVSSGQEHQ